MGRLTPRFLAMVAAGAAIGTFASLAGTASAAKKLRPPPEPAARSLRAVPASTLACSARWQSGCTLTGYQASGTDFRYAQAVITIPDGAGSPALPRFYVALKGRLAEARAGVSWNARAGIWQVYAGLWRQGHPLAGEVHPVPAVPGSHRVFVSMYYDRPRDTMHAVLRLPGGIVYTPVFAARHPRYPQALAVANWQGVSWGAAADGRLPSVRLTRFARGRFTTLSGQRGTFAGPWKLTRCVVSGSRVARHSWLVSSPGRLWADPVAGRAGPAGAFGIWVYRAVMP